MSDITDIKESDNNITAIYHTKDPAKANLLRMAILSEIETYAIDIVVFHINTSVRHDEIIALRLGLLVIDNEKFVPPTNGDFKTTIDVSGPLVFTTNHITSIPFAYETPITVLREGQRILCDVIVKRGKAKTHVKWRPVGAVGYRENDDHFVFKIRNIGMLSPESILTRGLTAIQDVINATPINIFFRPLIPNDIA